MFVKTRFIRPVKFITLACVCMLLFSAVTFADQSDYNKKVLAPTFVLFDLDDPETYIYCKKPDLKIMPASTTKIMTCILALEHCPDLNVIVSVPDNAVKLKSTNTLMGLKRGEQLPLIDLLYGMMLPSGNDAAIAVATHVSGSVAEFAELMNAKAQELGMTNSHFMNASGVYNGQHYSTAADMGKLAAYAMKNEMFRKIVSTAEYDVPANDVRTTALHLVNTNRLVSDPKNSEFYYEYAIGCKTGSTEKGGKCLVAAAEKNGITLIALFMGVKDGGDKSTRIRRCFSDAKMLFEAAFNNLYSAITPSDIGLSDYSVETKITNATKRNRETGVVSCLVDFEPSEVTLKNDAIETIRQNPSFIRTKVDWDEDSLVAPIEKGRKLGTVTVSYLGKTLFTSSLTADRSVEAYDPAEDITPSPVPTFTPSPSPTPAPREESTETVEEFGRLPVLYIYFAVIVFVSLVLSIVLYSSTGINKKRRMK